MATAGNGQEVTTTEGETLYSPGADGKCTCFFISNRAGSATLLINVANLHASGEFMGLPAGQSIPLRYGNNDMQTITVKVASGTAIIDFGKVVQL